MVKGNYQLVVPDNPQQFLFQDGSIYVEQPHYRSPAGRNIKLDLEGRVWSKWELSEAVTFKARETAKERGTKLWMPLGWRNRPKQELMSIMIGEVSANPVARLHYLHGDPDKWRHATRLYWRFRHPTLPIWNTLNVLLQGDDGPWITTSYGFYRTTPTGEWAAWVNVHDWELDDTLNLPTGVSMPPRPSWMDEIPLGRQRFSTVRAAVNHLGGLVRQLQAVQEIATPDMRDVSVEAIHGPHYAWLTTSFHDTNVTSELLDDIQLYVEGEPLVEDMAATYQQLQEQMRRIGISLPPRKTNEFLRAVAGGDAFRIPITPVADVAGPDNAHALHVDLVTGAFVVECNMRHEPNEQTHTDWEVAKFRAERTGELDELLAYARAWTQKLEQDRVRTVFESGKDNA